MPTLLALDASSHACSVALWHQPAGRDAEVVARYVEAPREHTRRLMPMVDEVLAAAGVSLADLDALAYGHGPGSFTGLRIAAGTAQGLAYGLEKPLLGVSTLAALALAAHRRLHLRYVLPALDARMGEIYVGAYRCHDGAVTPLAAEAVMAPERLTLPADPAEVDWVGVGSGWSLWPSMSATLQAGVSQHLDDWQPTAEELVRLAAQRYADGERTSPAEAQPVYLRDQVAWQKSR
ncbi:tRNA (adenosine(37)-N6)-threonylcarbamoyltransferase complex dimerization subunit type 1 TsaB [Halomonas sp. ML-15]|uniref:tRNA (adenosine(37)-N6)-threonylcarbamoyltransferase complex dimerization subunit type 1 TsaB n=1 Tax=Halomonas sp. ML-15 TaxID=2773305 RepID=UPI0017461991|nr:tRNA (adenosine(37)-N6)-threonylcarbamoyltransferase complex dimerization subunit type 1 TsaB [Halomonas sp. ML-15]MBD3894759.1 tRNA (adenosine(37)-N6)-threonylcarbamoyltransferase complex dimerization subunit type 1 TsaB [Halomonas sp. ML-15]